MEIDVWAPSLGAHTSCQKELPPSYNLYQPTRGWGGMPVENRALWKSSEGNGARWLAFLNSLLSEEHPEHGQPADTAGRAAGAAPFGREGCAGSTKRAAMTTGTSGSPTGCMASLP